MSVLNRQVAQTAAAVFDDHDCPRIERDVVRSHYLKHTRSNRLGSLIARPDQNHTRDRTTTGGQEVAEIQSHVRMILCSRCGGPVREGARPLRLLHATRGRLPSKFPCRPEVSRRGAREGLNFLVGQRRSVGYSASRMSSGSRSGYSRTISSGDIPLATRLTTKETVIRMPRMQAFALPLCWG